VNQGNSSGWPSGRRVACTRVTCGILAVVLLTALYWFLADKGVLAIVMDNTTLQGHLGRHKILGPVMAVLLIAGAIVFSPLPSAPIALATGAVFGHTWGTLYVIIGAMFGSLVAFSIARLLGYDVIQRWLGGRISAPLLESQNTLMGIVFLTRLVPFISFDIVSYGAGLTSLSLWRFAAATLAGIAPASFLLAHFGSELASADMKKITITALLLGSITLVPILLKTAQKRFRKEEGPSSGE
jgi:uncharacterized membrane protein YdjX (TVP38/TMEM64 family)